MRPFHPFYIIEVLPKLIPYLWVTLAVTAATVLFGGSLGMLLAACKIRRGKIGRYIANVYIYITRCVPSIVLLFLVYYGLPEILMAFGININDSGKGVFVVVSFSILFSASMAEVFRSAYEAVDRGQREAGVSIGMSEWQVFYRIIFPQAVVHAIPNFTNALVNLVKEGSLAYTIGLIDIMGKGQLIIGLNKGSYSLEIYIALAIIYWLLTICLEKLFGALESKLTKGKKALATV